MKKLLALITAPLSMTACIDLTEPVDSNLHPGNSEDGSSSDVETNDKGFAQVRTAYNNTNFVQEFDLTNTLASTGVDSLASTVATNSVCEDIDAMKGHFNAVASFSTTGGDIMETREGNLTTEKKTAIYEDETSFFDGSYTINGWDYKTAGYIDFALDTTGTEDKVELISNEYITETWNNATNEAVIHIRDGVTQIWRTGQSHDVARLTDSIYVHRTVSQGTVGNPGRQVLRVFNTNTGSSYTEAFGGWESDINTGTSCYVEGQDNSAFQMYIDEAKALDFIGSEYEWDTVDTVALFERPVFDFTEAEIKDKVGVETAIELK